MKRPLYFLVVALLCAASLQAQNLSFVACPVVRDTKTVPCWLAEYKGETYYLGNQGGVAQDFYPPQLKKVSVISVSTAPDGVNDPWSRKVTLSVKK